MYKKFFMLFLAIMFSGIIFISCSSDDDDGGTTPPATPGCEILSPNGGEILQMGDVVQIHFDDDLAENVAMYLYKGGDSLRVIDASIASSDSVAWLVPTIDVDTDYQIKIVSVDDPSIYDFSDLNFIIAPAGDYIIVNSSDGGDIWTKGSLQTITWYTNMTGTVRIDLYRDNNPYLLVYNIEANDGTQGWTIPNDLTIDASANYTLRVQSIENIAIFDESDNFFCIAEPTFDGNIVGDWTTTFSKQPTTFYFEADGTIVADSLGSEVGVGTYEMIGNGIKIIDELTSAYLIGIVDGDNMDGTMADDAGYAADWNAVRVIPDLLTPNGGEVWMHGTQDTIRWDDSIVGNVVLSLADTTGVVQEIATVAGDLGEYVWTVPATIEPGAAYMIRIAKEINGDAMDESDHHICIANTDVVDVIGDWNLYFYWSKAGPEVLTFANDNTWSGGGSSGTWEINGNGFRFNFPSGTYYIGNVGIDKIDGTMVDSAENLGVWDAQRLLDVTYPNGGEVFEMGDVVTITWDENLTTDEISIDLYENEVLVQNIGTVNINTYTSFNWTIPTDILMSTKYDIMISSPISGIYDGCDDFFTINGVAPVAYEYDNFEDGVADNWTGVDGTWAVVDSLYQVTTDVLNASTVSFDSIMTGNYTYEAKMRKVSGGDSNNYGMIVNGDPSTLGSAGNWNDCFMLLIRSNYNYTCGVIDSGTWDTVGSTSAAIVQGLNEWNTFKIIVNNDTHDYHLYINDVYLQTVNYTNFDQGKIGIKMYDGVAGVLEVDYVKVSVISKSELDKIEIKRVNNLIHLENDNQ